MPNLVHNERAKLIANALDRASTACLATGVIVPAGAAMLGLNSSVDVGTLMVAVVCWLVAAAVLHFEAQRVLRRLRESQ
jgi:hypothetical protein